MGTPMGRWMAIDLGDRRIGIAIADLCAGIFAAQGILVALLERGDGRLALLERRGQRPRQVAEGLAGLGEDGGVAAA